MSVLKYNFAVGYISATQHDNITAPGKGFEYSRMLYFRGLEDLEVECYRGGSPPSNCYKPWNKR